MHLGTQEIVGSTDWEITAGKGIITRTGNIKFSLQYIHAIVVVSQSLDTRNRPQIKDLQLELGNIQVNFIQFQLVSKNYNNFSLQIRSDGAGTFDYVLEFLINVIPNLLRYQIMDALENPAKIKIQEAMDQINMEMIIKEKIPTFEKMQTNSSVDFNDFMIDINRYY